MKRILYGIIALVVVLVVVALVAPSFIDWNQYKGEIEAQAKAATGRSIVIAGEVDLSVLPAPALSADDIRIANIEGGAADNLITLESLRVRVALTPLLGGRVEVTSITLVRPVIELEALADGRVNWELGTGDRSDGSELDAGADLGTPAERSDSFKLDNLKIDRGTVVYRDIARNMIETVEDIDASVAADSLAGPFRISGSAVARSIPLSIDLTVGRLQDGRPTPVNLNVNLDSVDALLALKGSISGPPTERELSGDLHVKAANLRELAQMLTGAAGTPGDIPPWLAQPISLQTKLTASADRAQIDDVTLELGGVGATGGIVVELGEARRADVALAITRVNLDEWFGSATTPADSDPQAPASEQLDEPETGDPSATALSILTPPTDFDASIDIGIEAVVYRGGVVRQVRANAALTNGEVMLSQISAQLPGGSEASLFGFVTTTDGKPRLDGTVELSADDLRGLLTWFGADIARIPPDRLRKFNFSSQLVGTPELVQLANMDIGLDASRMSGGLSVAVRERLAFGLSLTLDRFNLDAYVPAPDKVSDAAGETSEPSAQNQDTTPNEVKPVGPFAGLSFLEAFDANLQVQIGQLTYEGQRIQGLDFDGTLYAGNMTVRNFSVQDLAGAQGKFNGTLRNIGNEPILDASLDIRGNDAGPLAKMAGVTLPVASQKLGDFAVTGTANTDGKSVELDVQLAVAGGRIALDGVTGATMEELRYDVEIDAKHPELGILLDLFAAEGGTPTQKLGPFGITGKIKGGSGEKGPEVTLDTMLKLMGGSVHTAGQLSDLATAPAFALKLDVDFPDLPELVRKFAPAYRPGASNLGGMRLTARAKGNVEDVALSDLKGNLGPVNVRGDAKVTLDGAKPKVVAALTTSEILADLFLARPPPTPEATTQPQPGTSATGAAGTTSAKQGSRWSTEPFDLSALRGFDTDLQLAMAALTYGDYRVAKPEVSLSVADGVLELKKLTGQIFGGGIAANGRVDGARQTPTLNLSVNANDIDAGQALKSAGSDRVSGRISISTVLAGSGRNEQQLVSTLKGDGKFNGTVTLQISQEEQAGAAILGIVSGLTGILQQSTGEAGALLAAFGSTPSALTGSFTVDRGVVQLQNTRLESPKGLARLSGDIDLPAWIMDTDTTVSMKQDPQTALLTVNASGPIDKPDLKYGGKAVTGSKGILGGLEQLIPGLSKEPQKAQPSAVEGQEQQQQPAQAEEKEKSLSPEEFIKGILKGLGD